MRNLNVLHLIAPGPVGGAETVVIALARALARGGLQSSVAALIHDEAVSHPFLRAAEDAGVPVFRLRARHRHYCEQSRRVAEVIRSSSAGILHTHGYVADVIGALAVRRVKVQHVSTLHGFTGAGLMMRLYDLPLRWSHRQAAAVVAVSNPIVGRLRARGVRPERIALIPNAIAMDAEPLNRATAARALGIVGESRRIGWIGRLSEEKGPDILLEAAALVRSPDVRFSIIGDGPLRGVLEARARELGLHNLEWHGLHHDARRFLAAFDLVALTSRTEGTPMVLLEAAAAGVPIVATAVGGVPHMFAADHALLTSSEDPNAIARAIDLTLSHPEEAHARAQRAQSHVAAHFHPSLWAESHRKLYEAVALRTD